MIRDESATYGDRHALVYDRIYGTRFAPSDAVVALTEAAGDGALLELGVGTGRLAIPLTTQGVTVDGIEGSPAMIHRLQAQPGGGAVGIHQADLANFDLPRTDYTVAICAVSTLFMLPHDQQRTAIRAATRHLREGGLLFIEAFQPDPTRFDDDGRRVENRQTGLDWHIVRSTHDPRQRSIRIEHELSDGTGSSRYEVTLHYASTESIDAMAAEAGLQLVDRWHDWTQEPARDDSPDPINVYRKSREPSRLRS